MDTQTAERQLQALQQEAATLPDKLKSAVQAIQPAEMRRLKNRQVELVALILKAEMNVINCKLADLPSPQELARRARKIEAKLQKAEFAHKEAVAALQAITSIQNAEMATALGVQQERDRLLLERSELELRFASISGEPVFVTLDGRRTDAPNKNLPDIINQFTEPPVSSSIMSNE